VTAPMNLETVPIETLTPNIANYRKHPPEQIAHLRASLREYGWARNVVVSRDNVILAGHGIVEAARKEGHTTVPVFRLGLKGSDPRAEKFLVLENTVSRLAEDDDTQLAALLADVQRTEGLEGTGYADADLDALIAEMAGSEEFGGTDAAGASPWDRMQGAAADGVLFTFGGIATRLPTALYEEFELLCPDSPAEWIADGIAAMCRTRSMPAAQ
jgi:hypothetical protein